MGFDEKYCTVSPFKKKIYSVTFQLKMKQEVLVKPFVPSLYPEIHSEAKRHWTKFKTEDSGGRQMSEDSLRTSLFLAA